MGNFQDTCKSDRCILYLVNRIFLMLLINTDRPDADIQRGAAINLGANLGANIGDAGRNSDFYTSESGAYASNFGMSKYWNLLSIIS